MRHQSGEGEARKKRHTSAETGSEERYSVREVLIDDEIDPAEFFDPKEFGYRRHIEPRRP
jgi:hypothetical protein